jgi:hypothetical protein
VAAFLDGQESLVARLARQLLDRCRELTTIIHELEAEITVADDGWSGVLSSPCTPAVWSANWAEYCRRRR